MTTLLQLKSFVAVVDQGGFTAASRRLGLSQPAVSRAMATLEKELGLPLLVRGRDGTLADRSRCARADARAGSGAALDFDAHRSRPPSRVRSPAR